MSDSTHSAPPGRTKLILAFAAVYVIWGSTYLAILYAIETLPPFLMAGTRFVVAGALLYLWARSRGLAAPTRTQWLACAGAGLLMLMGGNGAVVWAEQRVPSGVAALLVAIVPCWMVLLDWLRGGMRPTPQVVAGLVLGLLGLALLVGPEALIGGGRVDTLGAIVLVVGGLSWAAGSLYSRGRKLPRPRIATAAQMLAGGAGLLVLGTMTGEWTRIDPAAISTRSLLALLYLVVFGSLIAFSAYVWLLRVSTPAKVSTYAYVNPIVAVLLGWTFAGEALTWRMIVAAAVIVTGVALITLQRRTPHAAAHRGRMPAESGTGAEALRTS
jgi:drug/metabolite transporter (DMT)-like permease